MDRCRCQREGEGVGARRASRGVVRVVVANTTGDRSPLVGAGGVAIRWRCGGGAVEMRRRCDAKVGGSHTLQERRQRATDTASIHPRHPCGACWVGRRRGVGTPGPRRFSCGGDTLWPVAHRPVWQPPCGAWAVARGVRGPNRLEGESSRGRSPRRRPPPPHRGVARPRRAARGALPPSSRPRSSLAPLRIPIAFLARMYIHIRHPSPPHRGSPGAGRSPPLPGTARPQSPSAKRTLVCKKASRSYTPSTRTLSDHAPRTPSAPPPMASVPASATTQPAG